MLEQNSEPAESQSALGDAIASSPEALKEVEQQVSDTQNPPAEQGENQEPEEAEEPKIPYSRFKEVVEERNYLRQLAEQQLAQKPQQQPQQPTTPQEIGNTPEEREFFNGIRKIAREEAQREQEKLQPVIDAARKELAQIGVTLFRQAHPDVKPGSAEEIEIAQRIGAGYPTEDAYKTVMYDRKLAQVEKQVNSNNKLKIEAKKQANLEQRSIPQGATAPTGGKETQREKIERIAREQGF